MSDDSVLFFKSSFFPCLNLHHHDHYTMVIINSATLKAERKLQCFETCKWRYANASKRVHIFALNLLKYDPHYRRRCCCRQCAMVALQLDDAAASAAAALGESNQYFYWNSLLLLKSRRQKNDQLLKHYHNWWVGGWWWWCWGWCCCCFDWYFLFKFSTLLAQLLFAVFLRLFIYDAKKEAEYEQTRTRAHTLARINESSLFQLCYWCCCFDPNLFERAAAGGGGAGIVISWCHFNICDCKIQLHTSY